MKTAEISLAYIRLPGFLIPESRKSLCKPLKGVYADLRTREVRIWKDTKERITKRYVVRMKIATSSLLRKPTYRFLLPSSPTHSETRDAVFVTYYSPSVTVLLG